MSGQAPHRITALHWPSLTGYRPGWTGERSRVATQSAWEQQLRSTLYGAVFATADPGHSIPLGNAVVSHLRLVGDDSDPTA